MRVHKSIEIAAPTQRIWPFLVEPEKVMQWCVTFRKFEYSSERRSGEGTPIYIEEKAGGPLMKMNFEITECRENEKLALRMVSGTGVKSYEQTWLLESIPSGSRFTFAEDVGLPYGAIGRLIGQMMAGRSEETVDKMLLRLKALAEA